MSGARVRFAPSPTGGLSIGAARTALFSWLFARSRGGVWIVRFDGTDLLPAHQRPEADLIDDLQWLGLGWDEGVEEGGPHGPYRQGERLEIHRRNAERLAGLRLAYPCFCATVRSVGERGSDRAPRGRCSCRRIAPSDAAARRWREPHVLRLNGEEAGNGESAVTFNDLVHGPIRIPLTEIGDPILIDREARPSSDFATAVDDREMAITHVIREGDQLSGTPVQILVAHALGAKRAPEFAHLPVITGRGGASPSGPAEGCTIGWFRDQGYTPEALINGLALLGWTAPGGRDLLGREELLRDFDFDRVTREPVVFDPARFDALSARHMARLPESRLVPLAIRHLQSAGRLPAPAPIGTDGWVGRLVRLYSDRLVRMADLPGEAETIFEFDGERSLLNPGVRSDLPIARRVIASLVSRLDDRPLTAPRFQVVADEIRRETGVKGGDLYNPLRVALTGAATGPELVKLLPVIEEGHRLHLAKPISSCAERARAILAAMPGEID